MTGIKHHIKLYSYSKGKHIVAGVRFERPLRARQFKEKYTRTCSITVQAQYNCCKDGEIVLDVPAKEIGATQTVRKDVTLEEWTDDIFGRIASDINEKAYSFCAQKISSSESCNVDVSIIKVEEIP